MNNNMFILSHGKGSNNYFHLYFMVKIEEKGTGKKKKVRYFAELNGRDGPETLKTWRIVNKHTDISQSIYKTICMNTQHTRT